MQHGGNGVDEGPLLKRLCDHLGARAFIAYLRGVHLGRKEQERNSLPPQLLRDRQAGMAAKTKIENSPADSVAFNRALRLGNGTAGSDHLRARTGQNRIKLQRNEEIVFHYQDASSIQCGCRVNLRQCFRSLQLC